MISFGIIMVSGSRFGIAISRMFENVILPLFGSNGLFKHGR